MNNPVNFVDPSGLKGVSFLVCETINAAYSVNSLNDTLDQLTESTELLRDQLDRVNNEIAQCPSSNISRLEGLNDIRNDLIGALGDNFAAGTPMSLGDLGPGIMRAGACAILLVIPVP